MNEFIKENGKVILAVMAIAALMAAAVMVSGDIQDIVRGSMFA